MGVSLIFTLKLKVKLKVNNGRRDNKRKDDSFLQLLLHFVRVLSKLKSYREWISGDRLKR